MDIIIVYDNIKDRKFFDLHEFKIPFNLEYINDKRTSYKIKTHWGAIKSPFVEIKDDNKKTIKVFYSDIKGDNALIQLINYLNNEASKSNKQEQ